MTVEEIRYLIISRAVTYSEKYRTSIYQSVTTYARYLYNYSTSRGLCTPFSSEYRERFFDFILGNNTALNDSELRLAATYFKGIQAEPYDKKLLEKLKSEISKHRAEISRLTNSTDEIRRDQKSLRPFMVMPRISDYIRYIIEVTDTPCNGIVMYTSLYHIGYVDGIRAERKRRNRSKNNNKEETADVR